MTEADRAQLRSDDDASLTIREATAADVPHVVALVDSAYRGESSRAGWTTEADLLDGQRTDSAEIEALVADPAVTLLIAERSGSMLGCCQLEDRGERAYFGLFAVNPQSQGSGVGKQIIAYVERYAARELGATYLEMTVLRQRTDLIAFYQRRGYRDTKIRSPFPYGDERFGVPRIGDLEFTLLEKKLPEQ